MTRLLLLPDGQSVISLEGTLPPADMVRAVQEGAWHPPPPYDAWLIRETRPLQAVQAGEMVIIFPSDLPLTPVTPTVLSPQQAHVLQRLALGLSTRQIAAQLHLTPRTVTYHIGMLKDRLAARSRSEIMRKAAVLGLLKPES